MDRRRGCAPGTVLLSGTAGMALGLWFDAGAGGVAALASLCVGDPRDLAAMLALHWALLPGMHLGMAAGVLAPCWLERRWPDWGMIVRSLFCLAWMGAGMAAGTIAFASLAGPTASSAAMLSWMLAGMAGGMAAGTAIGRLATAWAAGPTLGTRS